MPQNKLLDLGGNPDHGTLGLGAVMVRWVCAILGNTQYVLPSVCWTVTV